MVGRIRAPNRVPLYQVSQRTGRGLPVPCVHMRPTLRLVTPLRFALLVAVLVTACAGSTSPSFEPTGSCTSDGSVPGAYPELEALVPALYMDVAPGILDSGRNCSAANLGSLVDLGITEMRFAGGTWTFGAERAAVLAVFTAPGLTAEALADVYLDSARTASRTKILGASTPTVEGRSGRRLDTQTGPRLQTVLVWPSATTDQVNVVITNDLPDARIDDAVAAFEGR